jgi:hypothetical protein
MEPKFKKDELVRSTGGVLARVTNPKGKDIGRFAGVNIKTGKIVKGYIESAFTSTGQMYEEIKSKRRKLCYE